MCVAVGMAVYRFYRYDSAAMKAALSMYTAACVAPFPCTRRPVSRPFLLQFFFVVVPFFFFFFFFFSLALSRPLDHHEAESVLLQSKGTGSLIRSWALCMPRIGCSLNQSITTRSVSN